MSVRIIRTNWIFPPQAIAQTWGNRILVRPNVALTRSLIAHELAHVDQWGRLGWRFPLVYLWHLARAGFDPHDNDHGNPLEVEAHAAEDDPRYLMWADRVLGRK